MRTRRGRMAAGVRFAALLAFLTLLIGSAIVVGQAGVEAVRGPAGTSLVDGYWVGRLPATPIGVGLALGGSTVIAVAGMGAAVLGAGWVVRLLCALLLTPVVLWWAGAALLAGVGACCGPPPPFDPITAAYSNPAAALALVTVPALLIGLLVWLFRRPDPVVDRSVVDQFRTVSGA